MRKVILLLATLCVVTLGRAQNYYEFIPTVDYVGMASNAKDSSQISDIRKSILQDESLSKDEKVNLITKVGEMQVAMIEHENNVELGWIYAEAAISASIRAVNLFFNKNPVAASSVDAFAEQILQGNVRDVIVKGAETGDWSGLLKVCSDMGIDMALGATITKGLEKIPAVRKAVENSGKWVVGKVGNTGTRFGNPLDFNALNKLKEKWNLSALKNAELMNEVETVLKPQVTKLEGEIKAISAKISQAATQEEKNILEKSLVAAKNDLQNLNSQLARKNFEITTYEALINQCVRETEEISKRLIRMDFPGSLNDAFKTYIENKGAELIKNGVASVFDFVVQLSENADEHIQGEILKQSNQTGETLEKTVNDALAATETEYKRKISEGATKYDNGNYDNGNVVLTGGVEENVYVDNSTGEIIQIDDGDVPANILNSTFADDPAEPRDAQTLANEAFDKEIDKIVKDVADGDESLAQKIKDFVKGKIDEAVKKGEEWIENGGIRKTILEQVDKMLEGKVSPADAQRIHNLVDTLCNVNKDGGESFLETLGTDGKDLAVSLAVEALKKQLADALPEDIADTVNTLLDVFKEQGSADDYKKAALGKLQDLIANHVPYENTANTLNGILQSIADGNAIDVMDSIKDVGKNLGVDLLKDVISKNLDPELANRINALLDGFAQNGMQGVTDEALKQIYDLIDRCAPGADSAQKIKDIIKGTINGTVTAPDLRDAATSIVVDGAKKLINGSDLPQPIKDAANVAIDGLAENGITGLTENVGDYIQDYITDQLGEDAGNAAREIYDAVVTPGEDAWESIVTNAPTIGKAIGQKVLAWVEGKIAAQIDKLIGKYPELKNILDRLGITGKGIVQGVKNVLNVLFNAKDLKDAMKQLSTMAVNFLKNALGKLIDIGLEYAFKWLASNLVPKVVDWATTKLQKWANSASNPLLKKGLQWLAGQVSNCKKCANAKIKISGIGDKVIKGVEKIIDGRKKGKVHIETK